LRLSTVGRIVTAIALCACATGNIGSSRPDATSEAAGDGSSSSGPPVHGSEAGLIHVDIDADFDSSPGDPGQLCAPPPQGVGADAVLAPAYATAYTAYELGSVPGVPDHLGGCVIAHDDPNTLYFAGDSESETGALYAIAVDRDACHHIVGWKGTATKIATTPYIDANLVYTANNVLFYSGWPQYELSQLLPGAASPARTVDLMGLGMTDSAGGLGFVPPSLPAAGQLRAVGWPEGLWYHIDYRAEGDLFSIASLTSTIELTGGPGGFAYVPAGSPLFPKQSVIEAEWSVDKVSTYEVDGQGDPILTTRKEFFTQFPKPWGAYFEPVTGDYMFLTWGWPPPDRVFIVQGFEKPPPPSAIPR
jgi:hypothetical protein